MSLRAFHLVFVTFTTLLFTFMAVWAFLLSAEPSGMVTTIGVLGVIGAVGMPVYGIVFYKKVRNILL